MPDGPAAEPRRAVRKLASSSVSGRGHGSAGTWLSTSGLSGTTGVWGRRRGSRSSASVAAFPSASGSAVSARLAAESSPRRTSALARAARRSTSVPPAGGRDAGRAGVEAQAARRRECQSPRRKASARRSSSSSVLFRFFLNKAAESQPSPSLTGGQLFQDTCCCSPSNDKGGLSAE